MGYAENTTAQMTLFPEEKITTTTYASIPVYRISLVCERQLPSYECRIVFKAAILSNCAPLILGHNHPSGDPQPSREDRAITQRLVESGKLLGIAILDHVITGDGTKYFSFADEGILERC